MNSQMHNTNVILNTPTESGTSRVFKHIDLLDPSGFDKHCKSLTPSQLEFVHLIQEWFQAPHPLVCLVTGGPGTGKTFTVIQTLYFVNANILKVAPTNKVARAIRGMTIHTAFQLKWVEGTRLHSISETINGLDNKDFEHDAYISTCLKASADISEKELNCPYSDLHMVVIDEIGMVPFWLTYQLIVYLFKTFRPLLIVLMGDEHQLRPVRCSYNVFDVNLPDIPMKRITLTENNRFTPEYQVTIEQLKILINHFEQMTHYVRCHYPVYNYMTETLFRKCNAILAYQNNSVARYNEQYLDLLPGPSILLLKLSTPQTFEEAIRVKMGCRVMSTSNKNVPKGTVMTFISYDNKNDTITCQLSDEKFVTLLRSSYTSNFPIEMAFATTIHKFQGDTIDHSIVIDFDYATNAHLVYTALSRVKSLHQILGIVHMV
ncbi:ATP-dependent DNA helicase pif1-like [Parasteatoda tepidariorum]|uniref:ATP-dependent DNA helicase pif1-like n=1 Tax=Parasteatoda tepidariorum TaxID=114398 RepID=UPI00077F8D53|nr:ATP-dependent DNA helicase pif1-like [Parasteatoda tepidariorum]